MAMLACRSMHTSSLTAHPEGPWLAWQLFSLPRFRTNSASDDRKWLLVNVVRSQCPLAGIICYYDMSQHVQKSLFLNMLERVEQSRERKETNQDCSCGGMLVPRTWRVFRCWFPGPGGWGENEKGSEGLHTLLSTAGPITGQSQCSQHAPWLFAISKLWIICYLRRKEGKKIKIKIFQRLNCW